MGGLPRRGAVARSVRYAPRPGFKVRQDMVDAVAAEASRIGRGRLRSVTAKQLVDAARDPKSPCHKFIFDRSVEDAAEIYYLDRARYLLRAIDVVYIDKNGAETQTRAFQAVYDEDQADQELRAYGTAGTVFRSPSRSQVVADAKKALLCWVRQYREYSYLAGVVADVEGLLRRLK